jgi:hypothetical protein
VTSTTSRDDARPTELRSRPRARLAPWRKLLLAAHVIGSVGLLGADAAVLTLAWAGWAGASPVTVYPAAYRLGMTLIVPLALFALTTGLAQALLSRWGLLRYWWLPIKLALTIGGTVLALFVLLPALRIAATTALSGQTLSSRFSLVQDTGAASLVLITTILLAYYKPFGRLHAARQARPAARRGRATPYNGDEPGISGRPESVLRSHRPS